MTDIDRAIERAVETYEATMCGSTGCCGDIKGALRQLAAEVLSLAGKDAEQPTPIERGDLVAGESTQGRPQEGFFMRYVPDRSAQIMVSKAGAIATVAADTLTVITKAPRTGLRATATTGGPCETCGRPRHVHLCISCAPATMDAPGSGCLDCRQTGWDQTPCLPPKETAGG